MHLVGVDFTSAPSKRKPITAAHARLERNRVVVERVDAIPDWPAFDALLAVPGPWVGAFDFPFGFARELVDTLGWPGARARAKSAWSKLVAHYATMDRTAVGVAFDRFRAKRPVGGKYAHRATEVAAVAHASMKLVNPPVGWMLHEGAPRLLQAGVHLPGLREGDRARVALEAYPGMVMRRLAQARGLKRAPSYKNDAKPKQTPEQREARVMLLWAMVEGASPWGLRVDLPMALAERAIADPTGDTLDAIACALLAGVGAARADAGWGMPAKVDPVEGWIVGA